ncbi:MAG: hypothetical protein DCC68_13630 [Planctomycetota bacterium]|nr:MAG: hypothetical protein DCC68_13630 [Planctomycetota bacterium]
MNYRRRSNPKTRTRRCSMRAGRGGFTLAEVLVASGITVMIAGAMAVMATGVEQTARYTFALEEAHQHGRVALERIQSAVQGAASSSTNPPAAVLADVSGAYTFPETLVAWKTDNGDDVPQASELVVFCANPSNPTELWELTNPGDTQTVSMIDTTALAALVSAMKSSGATRKTVLTTLLRSCTSHDLGPPKPAVRFTLTMRPSATEWSQYQASTLAWSDLSWAQGIYGTKRGLRQVRVTCELQIIPDDDDDGVASPETSAVPFLGSAAMYYELPQ